MPITKGWTRCGRGWSQLLIAAAAIGLAPPVLHAAPKTDVVTLANGDRITGEVKGLEQGRLELKTDAAETIYIEWDRIATLQTNQYLRIEVESGVRYLGQVPKVTEPKVLRVVTDEDPEGRDLKMTEVVRFQPIVQGDFFKRLDGYVTAGYNYTKANNLQQFTFTGGINSRTEVRQWSLDGSSTVTTQQGNQDSSRWNISGSTRRFLKDRWFLQGFGGFEGNDELALDLRSTVGGAFGRYLVQTNRQEWSAYAGLDYTRANYVGRDSNNALEAVIGTQYDFFRFRHPEASLDAKLNLYPSLTQSGRFRAEGDLRARYEIVKDLFFELSLYGSYDNDPGENAASNTDYGLVTSLGYTF